MPFKGTKIKVCTKNGQKYKGLLYFLTGLNLRIQEPMKELSSSFCHFRVPSADGISKKMRRKKKRKKNMRCSFYLLNLLIEGSTSLKNIVSVDVL